MLQSLEDFKDIITSIAIEKYDGITPRIGMLKRFLTIYILGRKRSQHHMIEALKKSLQLSGKKSVKENPRN